MVLRILHVSSLYPPIMVGGAEKVASALAEAQAAAGHEVYACSLTRDAQPAGERNGVITCPVASRNPLWIEDSSRFPGPVRLLNKAATVFNLVTAGQFAALLDRVRPDVVHSHSLVEWPPAIWDKAARRGIPIVHTLHDYDLLCIRAALFKDGRACEPRHLACRLLSAPKQALHDRITLVAAVSQRVLDTHLAHGLFAHLPPERRQVIWNPVDLPAQPALRAAQTADAPLRFGYLGRLVEEKGLSMMIAAARMLPGGGWTLTIAGDGRDRARFEAEAAGLPVRFAGRVEAAAFLAEIDVLVSVPLWDEPFGLTTLEAYAAGCRVIGSERGFIGEAVAGIDPDWSIAPGDAALLAEKMGEAIAHSGQSVPNSDRVRQFLSQLQHMTVAQRYVSAYEMALAAVQ